jgi:hypothetical protein
VSNNIGTQPWAAAAACPRPSVPSTRGFTPLSALYVAPETGRKQRLGVDKQVETHVFAELAAAQVKDAGIRMQLGPPPWSPSE